MSDKRIALVTGANRGIGYEVCRQLAGQGIHVILSSRDVASGQAAAHQLQAAGLDVSAHQLDVTDRESIRRLLEFIERTYARLDILVNNAGIYIDQRHRLLEVDGEVLRRTMDTNAYGPLWLTQACVPLMKRGGYGRIVNISSGIGELSGLGSTVQDLAQLADAYHRRRAARQ